MNNSEFHCVIQLDKLNIFSVNYYTLNGNKNPYFATTAERFIRSKRDYCQCGQAQETICKPFTGVYKFYKKWDKVHLRDLTPKQYARMRKDLSNLENNYNVQYKTDSDFRFSEIVEFSKQTPKISAKKLN